AGWQQYYQVIELAVARKNNPQAKPKFLHDDLNRLPLHHRYLLVVPDGFRMVMFHISTRCKKGYVRRLLISLTGSRQR
ncbi:hypothetical protein O5559_29090, partial [Escherichia coli]|nr:hypothetical protein [Escherichia coli]